AHIQIHERLLAQSGVMENQIEAGDLKILVPYRRVVVCGREVTLKNREFELLLFLASNPGRVFSKEELLDRIWGTDAFVDTATVTVHVNRLRDKIERDSANPEYILTVWGAGYRFRSQS
ncbi:MAG: winged helix-turn-helix transcriptional regulator, partial [Lachnospiraceae bacterium]|nr:winged helix-turn-helix transcriptional regulator [Lachnospiraceae bacterium]